MGELVTLTGQAVNPRTLLDPYYKEDGLLPSRCMEDRPLDPHFYEPAFQIVAGNTGEGAAFAVALETDTPGGFLHTSEEMDTFANLTAKILGSKDHDNCAGRGLRPDIFGFIAIYPEIAIATARELNPQLEYNVLTRAADAIGRITADGSAVLQPTPKRKSSAAS